jgi:hypothetical protein
MVSTKHSKYGIGLYQRYYHHTTSNICYAGKCSVQEARKGGTAVQLLVYRRLYTHALQLPIGVSAFGSSRTLASLGAQ